MPLFRQIFPALSSKGSRYSKIEDRIEIRSNQNVKIFAVYDGHAGSQVSEELSKNFGRILHRLLSKIDPNNLPAIRRVIKTAFVLMDMSIRNKRTMKREYDPGSTAVMAIFFSKTNRLFFVHSGDSRAVLYRVMRKKINGTTKVTAREVMSTSDHKPLRPDEEKRIKAAGGHVTKASKSSVERVDGILAVSRSFGDYHLKQNGKVEYDPIRGKVSVVPDIRSIVLQPGVEYRLFLASDGLWDEMSNEELGQLASFETISYPTFGKQLLLWARTKGGDDDISIIGLAIKV